MVENLQGQEPLANTTEARNLQAEEILNSQYETGVIIPYSSNIHTEYPSRTEDPKFTSRKPGEPFLSVFSALAVVSTAKLYDEGKIKNILLCGETPFGENISTTSDLMKNRLIQLKVPENAIHVVEGKFLDNTPLQIEALATHQKAEKAGRYLMVDWEFHDPRVRNNSKAYGLNADTVTVESVLKNYFQNINLDKFEPILEQFQKREGSLPVKILGGGKAPILKLISKYRGGSVTDIEVITESNGQSSLRLVDTTGKARLKEIEKNKLNQLLK
ncbi:MAG TPA: hypothetical protein PLD54_01725 [Candidatus Levybacteria bacterium]|nr:hypothetical protein [Candidatus Levybacteria bacterium]